MDNRVKNGSASSASPANPNTGSNQGLSCMASTLRRQHTDSGNSRNSCSGITNMASNTCKTSTTPPSTLS